MGTDSISCWILVSIYKMKFPLIYMTIILAIAQGQPAVNLFDGIERYMYFPDGDGLLHLVDLDQQVTENELKIDEGNIRFFLFTRDNPSQREELFLNNPESIANSHFVADRPVKFIVHGWMSSFSSSINPLITQANLNHADVNVIIVDWSYYANSINYNAAARNVPFVGKVVAEFIDFLNTQGVPFAHIHLVGFSLGGHLVGSAGRNSKLGIVPRITALDPAGPKWGPENSDRINPGDAEYVEIIHTNSGFLGNDDLLGHVDYYPNGGKSQPGCLIVSCSHRRAYEYYAESIENENFKGIRCANEDEAKGERCSGNPEHYMGGAWGQKSGDGIFHLVTNRRSPFAQV